MDFPSQQGTTGQALLELRFFIIGVSDLSIVPFESRPPPPPPPPPPQNRFFINVDDTFSLTAIDITQLENDQFLKTVFLLVLESVYVYARVAEAPKLMKIEQNTCTFFLSWFLFTSSGQIVHFVLSSNQFNCFHLALKKELYQLSFLHSIPKL